MLSGDSTDNNVGSPTPAILGKDPVHSKDMKTPPNTHFRNDSIGMALVDHMADLVKEVTPTHFRLPIKEEVGGEKRKQRVSCTSAAGPYFMTLVRTLETHGEFHEKTAQVRRVLIGQFAYLCSPMVLYSRNNIARRPTKI